MQDETNNNYNHGNPSFSGTESSAHGDDSPPPNDCQAQQQPQQFNPYGQPVYYPVYIKRPKVPGKGFGIASMVLGIIGIVYSFFPTALLTLLSIAFYSYGNTATDENMEMIMGLLFASSIIAILACVFSIVSRNKGYRNAISKSGFILSVISVLFIIISFIIDHYGNGMLVSFMTASFS